MKSGPFPPPANKSNSLNRGCSPSNLMYEVCEEDQRINKAQSIIQQITMSVLSSGEGDGQDSTNGETQNEQVSKITKLEYSKIGAGI
jgi:hypothetical protein